MRLCKVAGSVIIVGWILISMQAYGDEYPATPLDYGFYAFGSYSYLCASGTKADACYRKEADTGQELCDFGTHIGSSSAFECQHVLFKNIDTCDGERFDEARVEACSYTCATANHEVFGGTCKNVYPYIQFHAKENPKNSPQGQCSNGVIPLEGNPVNVATGNKSQAETDIASLRKNGLVFNRYYNSMPSYSMDKSLGEPHFFATKWSHSYSRRIVAFYEESAPKIIVFRDNGQQITFTRYQEGSGYYTDADIDIKIFKDNDLNLGPVWTVELPDDSVEIYSEVNDGFMELLEIRKGGQTTSFTYDLEITSGGDGNSRTLDEVTDHFGRKLKLTYSSGRLHTVTDPNGEVYTYTYDRNDNLQSVTYPDSTVRQYVYEDFNFPANLTGIIDENNNRYSTWAYDLQGRAISSEHANGAESITFTYDDINGTTAVTDQLGASRIYSFIEQFGVVKTAAVTGDQCTFCGVQDQRITYDSNGFVASRTDFNGNVTTYINNSRGLQTSRTEAFGTSEARTITTEWHSRLRLPVKITEPGKETSFTYNDDGLILSRVEKDTNTSRRRLTTYTYDENGNLLTADGPRVNISDITTFTYDIMGNRSTMSVDPDGPGDAPAHVTQFTAYDNSGRLLSMTDPNGVVTDLSYDARGRLKVHIQAAGTSEQAITNFDYDAVGNLIDIQLPDGNNISYSYDQAHRLIRITDSSGNYINYTRDNQGNRTKEEVFDRNDVLQRTLSRTFDQLGRLIQMAGGENQASIYGYDGNGNQVSVLDPLNRHNVAAYDALNRLISQTDTNSNDIAYEYDYRDNLIAVTDPRGLRTAYIYDSLDNLVQMDSPDTGVTVYHSDNAGNRVIETDARGISKTYTYDALNRLTGISYPDSRYDVDYIYDEGINGIGRMTSMTDSSGATHFRYNTRGNLIQQDFEFGGNMFTTSYAYDYAGNLIQTQYPSGRVVDMTLDAQGRIQRMVTSINGAAQALVEDATYLPFGPINSFDFGNGLNMAQQYDMDYRLMGQLTAGLHNNTYTYDAANNVKEISDGVEAQNNQSFNYDNLDRLLAESGSYGTRSYLYDEVGNRIQRTKVDNRVNAQGVSYQVMRVQTFSYNENANILDQIETNKNGTISRSTYTHDANGNLTHRGINNPKVYGYGDHNRLIYTQKNGITLAKYKYNGRGERKVRYKFDNDACQSTADDACTDPNAIDESLIARTFIYHYDQQGQLLAETIFNKDNLLKRTREYVWLYQRPVAYIDTRYQAATGKIRSENIYYVHTDHLDTPRKLTDQAQTLVWRWDSDAFGQGKVQNDPDGDTNKVNMPLRFPGQIQMEAGLRYNYYRDYSPGIGRYVQSDPIGLSGGINTYNYALQNPIRYLDPTGEIGVPGAFVGGVLGFGSSILGSISTGGLESLKGTEAWVSALGSGLFGSTSGFAGDITGGARQALLKNIAVAGLTNFAGQTAGLRSDSNICNDNNYNYGSLLGSMLGGGLSSTITRGASIPNITIGWQISTSTTAVGAELGK